MNRPMLNLAQLKNKLKHRFPRSYSAAKKLLIRSGCDKKAYQWLLRNRYYRKNPTDKEIAIFNNEIKTRLKVFNNSSKARSIAELLNTVSIESHNIRFFYSIDVYKTQRTVNRLMVNSTIDYWRVVYRPLSDLWMPETDRFTKENNIICDALDNYVNRCLNYLSHSQHDNRDRIIQWLSNIKEGAAQTFEEALQRILYFNMVLWQTNHRLVGLGRLDYILDELYQKEKKNGTLDREKALDLIKDFFRCLHQYYWFKSDALMGDTGQIVILGGKQKDGSYFRNDLTSCFIDAVRQLQLPDPKVLLRVADNTPQDLIVEAIHTNKTGVGSPLFSNDELVIPRMIDFGYDAEDAYNYVTSACWEPLVPGVAHEQNNIGLYNFLLPLQLISEKEDITEIGCFEKYFELYCAHLCGHIDYINRLLDDIVWEKDPLLSSVTEPCRQKHTDIGDGAGKYNHYGVLSVAMSNTVNALLIIKKFVFDEKLFTLSELDTMRRCNFESHEDVVRFLRSRKYFGTDNDEAVDLTRTIMQITSDRVENYRNKFGEKIKFGMSSPGYIQAAEDFPASFDGRKNGEPFAVHISGDDGASITELMTFSSKLDYKGNKFNGNVTDFFLSPNLIENREEVFAQFLLDSFRMGVFQCQMNVVSSQTLIAARAEPEKFPDLIVRVWGFSAYYVELPDEYKDYLIQRALKSEGAMTYAG